MQSCHICFAYFSAFSYPIYVNKLRTKKYIKINNKYEKTANENVKRIEKQKFYLLIKIEKQ